MSKTDQFKLFSAQLHLSIQISLNCTQASLGLFPTADPLLQVALPLAESWGNKNQSSIISMETSFSRNDWALS